MTDTDFAASIRIYADPLFKEAADRLLRLVNENAKLRDDRTLSDKVADASRAAIEALPRGYVSDAMRNSAILKIERARP